ncbi:MAG: hypothetical protein ACI802_003112 [Candidatus Paceibacteria bacterium]|jgi:hypothetical protein
MPCSYCTLRDCMALDRHNSIYTLINRSILSIQGPPGGGTTRSQHFRQECTWRDNSGAAKASSLQQAGATISGYQVVRVTGERHREQKRVIRIIGHDIRGQPVQHNCTLKIIHHSADAVRLQHRLKLRITAGATYFVKLYQRRDHLEFGDTPSAINGIWRTVGRNKC